MLPLLREDYHVFVDQITSAVEALIVHLSEPGRGPLASAWLNRAVELFLDDTLDRGATDNARRWVAGAVLVPLLRNLSSSAGVFGDFFKAHGLRVWTQIIDRYKVVEPANTIAALPAESDAAAHTVALMEIEHAYALMDLCFRHLSAAFISDHVRVQHKVGQ
jgi:hypothetical protein